MGHIQPSSSNSIRKKNKKTENVVEFRNGKSSNFQNWIKHFHGVQEHWSHYSPWSKEEWWNELKFALILVQWLIVFNAKFINKCRCMVYCCMEFFRSGDGLEIKYLLIFFRGQNKKILNFTFIFQITYF